MDNKKILVVEDDADVRLGYYVLLKANYYDTFFAIDSLSAISEARKQVPDLIILDLGLPAGDGFVVLERLRSLLPLSTIPVIVVSVLDLADVPDGAEGHLSKPVQQGPLLRLLEQHAAAIVEQ